MIPWNVDIRQAISYCTELCRQGQEDFATGTDPFYQDTLRLVESRIPGMANQRPVIYHEDFQCFAHKGKLQGIFDVEMARLVTERMQLERVFRQ